MLELWISMGALLWLAVLALAVALCAASARSDRGFAERDPHRPEPRFRRDVPDRWRPARR